MKHFLPDPADLRWLVRSLDLRSFSGAAREMNVAVSVVTRGVDRLEAGYGVTLLRRSTHGLSATPEGAELVQEARALLAQMEDISAALSRQRNHVAGALRLASSQEICEQLLVPCLAQLRARHPALWAASRVTAFAPSSNGSSGLKKRRPLWALMCAIFTPRRNHLVLTPRSCGRF